jgi:hypothetical protein
MTQIANREHRTRTAVSEAVHSLAKLLDINLRQSKPGRRQSVGVSAL